MSARDKANRVLIHVILILVSITMLVPMDDSDRFQNYDRGNLCQPVRNPPVYMEMGQF